MLKRPKRFVSWDPWDPSVLGWRESAGSPKWAHVIPLRAMVARLVLAAVPLVPRSAAAEELPRVQAASAAVIDARTGELLYSKAPDEVRAIASTTKIFVAMVVRRRGIDLEGVTRITREDVRFARGGATTRLDIRQRFKN